MTQPLNREMLLELAERASVLASPGRIHSHPNIAVGQLAADLRALAKLLEESLRARAQTPSLDRGD